MIGSHALKRRVRRSLSLALVLLFTVAFLPPPPAAERATGSVAAAQEQQPQQVPTIPPGSAYRQTNLVTDSPGLAPVLDPLLVNPWGISLTATSPFWVANTGTATSTLYRGDAGGAPLVRNPGLGFITIPPTPPPPPGSLPTGTVANTVNTDFVLPGACASAPCGANFLFATLTGKIMGWDPNAPTAGSTTAVEAASQTGRVYTGLAIGNNGSGNFLYAADIRNNNIDVYNSSFALQPEASFPFTDPTVGPQALPADYHVHNIQALGGELYVTYARINPTPPSPNEPYLRPGGAVNVFNFNGVFQRRIALDTAGTILSAPWGLALAPATFGIFGNALLVGNFDFDGRGYISAYNRTTGAFLGRLQDEDGQFISIDGLWGLQFGNGSAGGDPNTLYFAAGIGHEEHGLFGKLNPTTSTATSLVEFATDNFSTDEAGGHVDFTVIRTGDTSGTATVNYNTFDESQAGHASQKSDYEIALGTLTFAPGETSKTFRVLIVDDRFDESDEVIDLMLSNPTGAGVGLGSPNTARINILDNDTGAPTSNPIDDPGFFVRQHYLDFLNREPDAEGLAFWTNQMTNCGNPNLEVCRINVSNAFFQSIEFQRTGVLAYATHRAAFGPNAPGSPAPVLYGNFMRDVQALQRGLVFGQPGFDAQLEANKVAYFNEFVTRPEFVARYPSTLTNAEYVDNLLKSANLSPDDFIVNMTNLQEAPPAVPTTTTGGAPRPASYGTARFVFNAGRTALTMSGTVNNIDFTGSQTADTNDNLTNAHIHASSAETAATRGVVFGFIGTPFNDNNPNDAVTTPFASGVGGTFSAKWDAPEGQNTTLAAQLDNLLAGRAYINFHTVQFGGGEVRGNFPALVGFRDSLVAGLDGGTLTRAAVLRMVAESEFLQTRERNATFVTMEYFGYLRRDPDTGGFNFWLGKLNDFNGNPITAEMVRAFILSDEYRQRFGPS
ncbi:MAG TPA: TIGR03118 family protein [Pyrinomonadaceae bacterium]|nr:TIGR03118 family protein [Pyrinomonadaceae bacterium]